MMSDTLIVDYNFSSLCLKDEGQDIDIFHSLELFAEMPLGELLLCQRANFFFPILQTKEAGMVISFASSNMYCL